METHLLGTRRATRKLGEHIASRLSPGALILLCGELGAGKTFLARAMLRALGVEANVAVPSPTFTLVQEYQTSHGTVLHADLFRIREGSPEIDLPRLGLIERRREGAILLVEWGEDYQAYLGEATLTVSLHLNGKRYAEVRP